MKIEFESINGLVDGILGSGVSVYEFAFAFLKEFDGQPTKAVARNLQEWDERTTEQIARMDEWEEKYSLADVPRWLLDAVSVSLGRSSYDAAMKVVNNTLKNSVIRKRFAWNKTELYFDRRGYEFLIEQFYNNGWISLGQYNQWKTETGLVPIVPTW